MVQCSNFDPINIKARNVAIRPGGIQMMWILHYDILRIISTFCLRDSMWKVCISDIRMFILC